MMILENLMSLYFPSHIAPCCAFLHLFLKYINNLTPFEIKFLKLLLGPLPVVDLTGSCDSLTHSHEQDKVHQQLQRNVCGAGNSQELHDNPRTRNL